MTRVPSNRVWKVFLVLPLLAAAPALHAWDRDIHVSLVRAAIGISAAAEARVPLEYRESVYKETVEPDAYDKDCTYHCSLAAPRDPAAEAAKVLALLTNPKVALSRYQRAQAIGRYVHYVADSVSPLVLRGGAAPKLLNFFANQDFVLFREPRPLGTDVAAGLRKRGEEVAWANANAATANPWLFRLVVNTIADALVLLPPRPEAASAADSGPVHFLVNRIDNGVAGKATGGEWVKTGHTYSDLYDGTSVVNSSGGYDTWSWDPGSKSGGQSFYKPNLMERKGLQLVELVAHQEASGVTLKALVFNNQELCAERVTLKAGAWSYTLPETLAPHALRAFTVTAPPDVLTKKLGNRGWAEKCGGQKVSALAVDGGRRRVYGNGGGAPQFDAVLEESDISHGSEKAKTGMNYSPSARQ